MKAKDVMTRQPAMCTPDDTLQRAAGIMKERDCGAVPVVAEKGGGELVGILTDRDIVVRSAAAGRPPAEAKVRDAMTSQVVRVTPDTGLAECCRLMEEHRVRRLPVVDENGHCVGIVASADVARTAGRWTSGKILKEVSRIRTREAVAA